MKKLPAVTDVRVSLNDGLTILDLKPGNTVTLAQLRQIIKHNGFVSKDAAVVARGALSSDQKTFIVSGTNEQLAAATPPRRTRDEWELKVVAPAKP
jgi:hypothetical protein